MIKKPKKYSTLNINHEKYLIIFVVEYYLSTNHIKLVFVVLKLKNSIKPHVNIVKIQRCNLSGRHN